MKTSTSLSSACCAEDDYRFYLNNYGKHFGYLNTLDVKINNVFMVIRFTRRHDVCLRSGNLTDKDHYLPHVIDKNTGTHE